MTDTKICKQCGLEKNISDFRHQTRVDKIYISLVCKKCDYENGKERQKDKKPKWNKKYYNKNKGKIFKVVARRTMERYHNEPNFRIRKVVSKAISRTLKLNNSSKNSKSCLKFLPYSINELKEHLEKQFEPWMTWNNYGIYKSGLWNDNDSSTWTWQIDHIVPQSDLPYVSMEDENFQTCWALNNLRPLSSKTNNKDGVNRIRHKGK